MCIQRPIHVSTGVTRTSWYRLMRPVKERSIDSGIDAGLEVCVISGHHTFTDLCLILKIVIQIKI